MFRFFQLLFVAASWKGIDCGRLVSVPDLHGDFERTLQILSHAGLIDARSHAWSGGNATLVQTGDIVDRGGHGKDIYELFFKLAEEAESVGGRVVMLMGNHELMNLQGDLRYVTFEDYQAFGGERERTSAWAVNGWLGQKVRSFPVAYVTGNVLFTHAGVAPHFLRAHRTVEGLNENFRRAVQGNARPSEPALSDLLSHAGPLWTRRYGGPGVHCEEVEEVLKLTGTRRMVVGHTIGRSVRSHCEGRLILGDTAISRYYGGEASYIEHDGSGGAVAIYPLQSLSSAVEL